MKKILTTFAAAFALVAVVALFAGADASAAAYTMEQLGVSADSALLFSIAGAGMTTLAANAPRDYLQGDIHDHPVIASDIIYQGAAVGLVDASGHARPLVGGDTFAGFAELKADNSSGVAAAINVRCKTRGKIKLSVSGAVITDVDQPVYATDDNTFVFSPVGASFIGFVDSFVESGVVIVKYDTEKQIDPWAAYGVRETISANKTLDIQDNGKLFWVDTDAVVITMPAVATPVNCVILNGGAFGTVAVNVSPDAVDKIQGPDLPGADNKDHINTKATARRGDYVKLITGDANGPIVAEQVGTWATEA